MSNGGKSEGKKHEQSNSIIRSGATDYSRAIARMAVAQLCESIGFEGFHESALDSLADIAIRYLRDLGKTSKFYANLSRRTECNVFDVTQALEDLGSPQGFSDASDMYYTECRLSSGAIREIKEYVESAEEIPFTQPVQPFPVIRERKSIPSFLQIGENPSFKHVPPWLPAFPDPHTYIRTPVWNERVSDPRTDKIELARQHRKAERSLLSLQQRLLCNGSAMENHVSLLETFAPAIEAMKEDGLDSGSDGEKIIPEKRASMFLDLKGGKKVFGEPLDLRIRNKGSGKTESWFGREDERDDKKRRVEFILRQSLENQQELPQL